MDPVEATDEPSQIIRVAITVPLRRCFDYWLAKSPFKVAAGMRVAVPFGKTEKIGVIVEVIDRQQAEQSAEKTIDFDKLKTAIRVLDQAPLLDPSLLKLYRWMVQYYHAPPGEIWQTMLPGALLKGESTELSRSSVWRLTEAGKQAISTGEIAKNALQQHKTMALLETHGAIPHDGLAKFAIKPTILKTLAGKRWVEQCFQAEALEVLETLVKPNLAIELNKEQQLAVDSVAQSFGKYAAYLLFGVTASGKTEVYLQLIAQVIANQQQALVLVPEIGLTPQTLKRFEDRFNVEVVLLHSGMTEKQRLKSWLKARSGEAKIIIGTRSALFVPLKSPGIIIIDEEHDRSFRQQQGFRYSARDVALVRAHLQSIPILLGSATPSLESWYNVKKNKFSRLDLSQKAKTSAELEFKIIDLKKQVLRDSLSVQLIEKIRAHLAQKNQVLLFLNRRGYAPVLLCHQCGWSPSCLRCDSHFTYHHQNAFLQCHHCGSSRKAPSQCPQCHCDQMVPVGAGTERLEETVKALFQEAKVARIDRDTTRRKSAMSDFVSAVKSGDIDILIGTQMLAKGHHFPDVTLVALIDMDGALYSADFRAPEYAAQLITQVSGRAGRAAKRGEVVLQTHHSEHPMLHQLINQGYQAFAETAISERIETELPPHSFSAMFQAESPQLQWAKTFLQEVKVILDRYSNLKVELMGPVPAIYAKKAGKFRYQLLLQTNQRNDLHQLLELTLQDIEQLKSAARVRWRVEIDPIGDT